SIHTSHKLTQDIKHIPTRRSSDLNRLENAVKKLYMAFTSGKLYPECCKQCAVGTILDGSDTWKHLSDNHGSLKLNYVGQVHQTRSEEQTSELQSREKLVCRLLLEK